MSCGIYQIRNILNNDLYIGQAANFKNREYKHFNALKKETHANRHLQRAYNKYGKENFVFEILLYCEPFELTRYEQELVNRLNPVYNICKECVDSSKGTTCTDEQKKQLSNSHKGYVMPEEQKIKIGLSNLGKIVSEETRLKIGIGNKGKIISEETRIKISISGKGRKHTDETKIKMSNTRKGHVTSIETRNKISKAHKEHICTKVICTLISPEGEIHIVTKLVSFCKKNSLNRTCVRKLRSGLWSQYKGWKVYKEDNT